MGRNIAIDGITDKQMADFSTAVGVKQRSSASPFFPVDGSAFGGMNTAAT
jgi:hypothetical protein